MEDKDPFSVQFFKKNPETQKFDVIRAKKQIYVPVNEEFRHLDRKD